MTNSINPKQYRGLIRQSVYFLVISVPVCTYAVYRNNRSLNVEKETKWRKRRKWDEVSTSGNQL